MTFHSDPSHYKNYGIGLTCPLDVEKQNNLWCLA